MNYVNLTCSNCNTPFDYSVGEYNRQTKKGRISFFCSRSCSRSFLNSNPTPERRLQNAEHTKRRNVGNKYAAKGLFTYYLNKARNRKSRAGKHYGQNITEQYLSSIWTGKCAITGIDIQLKKSTRKNTLTTASLDRIDHTKGYIEGNVQFVAYGINLAKNAFTDEEILIFLELCYQQSSWQAKEFPHSP